MTSLGYTQEVENVVVGSWTYMMRGSIAPGDTVGSGLARASMTSKLKFRSYSLLVIFKCIFIDCSIDMTFVNENEFHGKVETCFF